ncbi:uncharacterized protein LOC144283173 [Canis aureus]
MARHACRPVALSCAPEGFFLTFFLAWQLPVSPPPARAWAVLFPVRENNTNCRVSSDQQGRNDECLIPRDNNNEDCHFVECLPCAKHSTQRGGRKTEGEGCGVWLVIFQCRCFLLLDTHLIKGYRIKEQTTYSKVLQIPRLICEWNHLKLF